jgi:hypothetical protein
MKDFDPQTRCLIRNGIAGRYYGKPEDILEEIREPGFSVHDWHIHCDPQTNQPELFLIAGKREFV